MQITQLLSTVNAESALGNVSASVAAAAAQMQRTLVVTRSMAGREHE
jgi:hypothetical protein